MRSSLGRSPANSSAADKTSGRRLTSPAVLRNTPSRPSTQCTARPMSAGSVSGSYQVDAVCGRPSQGASAIDLIVCRATPSVADRGERLEVRRVSFVLHLTEVVREQHGVEREALERAAVRRGDREPMPGDTDEADESLLTRFDRGLQRTTFAQRGLPLDDVGQVVQLAAGRRDRHPADRASGGAPPSRPRSRARRSSWRRRRSPGAA